MFELIVAGFMFVALIFYAVTGDADYGGGMWDLLATGPRAGAQRAAIERAIGPIWEADHVWLILIVVILFTAFPPAFAAMMTALNIPFTLMLIGIILRGSAFIFRKYDIKSHEVKRGWSLLFGAASFFTPFIQGLALGALSTGHIRITDGRVVSGFFAGWLTPFAFACGLFALALFAFLAATYLTVDPSTEGRVQNDFRLRALCSGAALAPIAFVVFITSKHGAPEMYHGLTQWWAPLLIGATLVCAIAALASLWLRRFAVARFAAIGEVTLILIGWSLAQYPRLITPDITIFNAAAPETTLRLLTYALVAGAIVLFPSLFFLFRVFKGFLKEKKS
jgi:cytochrome bd ubiquinol oxidase subunit II